MARKPSAKAALAAERAALLARLVEIDALEKQAAREVRAARSQSKVASKTVKRAGRKEVADGVALVKEGKGLILDGRQQQTLFKRLLGTSKRYAPIDGYVPRGLKLGDDGAISTRQYNKLAAEIRGYEKQKTPAPLQAMQNKKRNQVLSRKRDYQKGQAAKGIKIAIKDVGRDPGYQRIAEQLNTRTKPTKKNPKGRPNEAAVKRALVALGRREGLPNSVRVGDSPIAHVRDKVTGIWHKKV